MLGHTPRRISLTRPLCDALVRGSPSLTEDTMACEKHCGEAVEATAVEVEAVEAEAVEADFVEAEVCSEVASEGSGMLRSERVSGIRQQDMAWTRQGQAATIRPEPGLKANITEPSCHGQPGEREGSRPAPADSGSDHCESCVQSPAPESHTGPRARAESQSQSRSRSRGITTGAPHPHTVTYKPQRGEEQ